MKKILFLTVTIFLLLNMGYSQGVRYAMPITGEENLSVTEDYQLEQKVETIQKLENGNREVIFSEGFEGTTGTALPDGWTVAHNGSGDSWISTDENIPDVGNPVPPNSGTRMMVLTHMQTGRDAWAFSTGIELTEGNFYEINFYLRMPGYVVGPEYSSFECRIGQIADPTNMSNAHLIYYSVNQSVFNWTLVKGTFSPSVTGTYYLGFHDFTNAGEGLYTAIDDIMIQSLLTTDFIFEDFSGGSFGQVPEGWIYDNLYWFGTEGIDNSPCVRVNLWNYTPTGSIQTPLVKLGYNPQLSFYYRATDWASPPNVGPPTPANNLSGGVIISTDNGATWTQVWTLAQGQHVPSAVHTLVDVDISAYTNEFCLVQIFFQWLDGDFILSIDNITVGSSQTAPIFNGPNTLTMGTVCNNLPGIIYNANYNFSNIGGDDLTIALISESDEITVQGLPMIVEPSASGNFIVNIDPIDLPIGTYSGQFVIGTNDPDNQEVTVNVTANVYQENIKSFIFEDFDQYTTLPIGWNFERFGRVVAGGIDNSACVRANLWAIDFFSIGTIQTCYVSMGTEPEISFYYRATASSSGTGDPALDDQLIGAVYISNDLGNTWNEIWTLNVGDHIPSLDYALVNIDANEYANELCLVRIFFQSLDPADIYLWVDNIQIGTNPEKDIEAIAITGNKLPTEGVPSEYTVIIRNNGIETLTETDYSVKLMQQGGLELVSQSGVAIETNETKEFVFTWTPTSAGPTHIYGYVDFPNDEYHANNATNNYYLTILNDNTIEISIGEGTDLFRVPTNMYMRKTVAQSLYYPYELGTNGGEIYAIKYNSKMVTQNIPDKRFKVWIGETELENLENEYVDPSTLTVVYDGMINFPTGDGLEVVIPLQTPYQYTGGTLVIYTYKYDAIYHNALDLFYGKFEQGNYRSRTHYMDGDLGVEMDYDNPGTEGLLEQVAGIPHTTTIFNMAGMGTLTGVIDNNNGMILQNAKVQIVGTDLYVFSDENGVYIFPYLTANSYNIEVSRYGHNPSIVSVTINSDNTTIQDVTLQQFPVVTVSGTVIDAENLEPIKDVVITLTGFDNYTTISNDDGFYTIQGVYTDNSYQINAKLKGWQVYNQIVEVGIINVTHNIILYEIPFPVTNVTAIENETNSFVTITWSEPEQYDEVSYIMDNGVANNAWNIIPNANASLGNIYNVGEIGEITSVDIYFQINPENNDRQLQVDIYNEFKELIGSSDIFLAKPDEWINVLLPDIPYSNTFYAMVQWFDAPEISHYMGYNESGPAEYQNNNVYFSHASGNWYEPFHTWQQTRPGVFMIRVNANIFDEVVKKGTYGTQIAQENENSNIKIDFPVLCSNEYSIAPELIAQKTNYNSKSLLYYKVYRMLEENQNDETLWEEVNMNVVETTCIDDNWNEVVEGIYKWAVIAEYTENLLSKPRFSNSLTKIFDNIKPNVASKVVLYPNPFKDEIFINSEYSVVNIKIFNAMGQKVKDEVFNNNPINTSNLSSGVYFMIIESSSGEKEVHKMVKR